MDYYLANGGAQAGPFPIDQLLANGLRPDSLVWHDGMGDWQPAPSVPELAALLQAAAGASFAAPSLAPPPLRVPQPAYGSAPMIPPMPQGPAVVPAYYAPPPVAGGYAAVPPYNPANSNRIAAGICGILLGGLGIHKFVLGFTGAGIAMLLTTVLTCGWGGLIMGLIGFIEGIIYLTKSDTEFYQAYVVQRRSWF